MTARPHKRNDYNTQEILKKITLYKILGANKVYYGGCTNDECYFRKAEASFTHKSELTQQDKGDNNFSSAEKTFR